MSEQQSENSAEESFHFGDAGANGSLGTTWSFEDMKNLTEAEIQEDLRCTFDQKILKTNGEVILEIPPLDSLDETYETFLSYRAYSFQMLSLHPYFQGKIDKADVKAIETAKQQRDKYRNRVSYAGIASVIFFNSFFIEKRALLSLTNNTSIKAWLFCYCLLPNIFADFIESSILHPKFIRQSDQILSKYNFQNEAQTNPYFQKAFNDLLIHKKNRNKENQSGTHVQPVESHQQSNNTSDQQK